jgi:hypothetical protein
MNENTMKTQRLTKEELPLAVTEDATFIVLKDGHYYLDFTTKEEHAPWNIYEALVDFLRNEPDTGKIAVMLVAELATKPEKNAVLKEKLKELDKKKESDD